MKNTFIVTLILLFGLSAVPLTGYADDASLFFKTNNEYQDVLVEKVIAPDLLLIKKKGYETEKIRLIGLEAPKLKLPSWKKKDVKFDKHGFRVKEDVNPATPVEEQAMTYVSSLLEGKRIRLEFDTGKRDENFQTLAYAFLVEDGKFINAEILRQGYANLHLTPNNRKYNDELRTAYQESRQEKRGFQGQ